MSFILSVIFKPFMLSDIMLNVACSEKHAMQRDYFIDIKSLQNRLLKVCYVPATSAGLPRMSFFFSFLFLLLQPVPVLMKY